MSKIVLLVDRNSNLLVMLTDYFSSRGLEVYTAESIEKGWQLYIETKPDIIVSSIVIQSKNCGYLLLKQVRDRNPQQPVIFLSTELNNSINSNNAARLEVNACLDMPFEPDELYQGMANILYSLGST